MLVLIVDNKSAHLKKLQNLIREKLGAVKFNLIDARDIQAKHVQAADLIVISGGWGRSIVKNPETFKRLIKLIENNPKPTIGICLGAEAIAAAYGSKLKEIPVRRVGNIRLKLNEKLAKDLGVDSAMVYEFHKWLINDILEPLEILATSKDGGEVLRHRHLPMWGVQFHPEVRRLDNSGHLIFEYILKQIKLKVVSDSNVKITQ